MLQFKKYAQTATQLKSLGTVGEFVGVGGKFAPSSVRNFQDTTKRVNILLTNANGETVTVNCSKPVSADLRSKALKISDLAGLQILELPQYDSDGNPVMQIDEESGEEVQLILHSISYQGGGNASSAAVEVTETMVKTPVQLAREVDWSQLIAL
jgi:hypothetical protein